MSGVDVLGFKFANSALPKAPQPQHYPYASSISSSASSSSSSIFSIDASQNSLSSSTSSVDVIFENEVLGSDFQNGRTFSSSSESSFYASRSGRGCGPQVADAAVAPELRQNPRRTSSNASSACPRPIPTLQRQADRKHLFVDQLVDSASQIVEIIWPLSVLALRHDSCGSREVLSLRTFIQETLRRSRTSYSTLQVALYYLILVKPHVPKHDFTMEQPRNQHCLRAMQCGRRMFLSALILASKYLQDRNYSARAWSKISGLNTTEINQNELAFLHAVNWKIHISEPIFQRWTDIVLKYTPRRGPGWKLIIPHLTPELDTIDLDTDRYGCMPDQLMSGTRAMSSPCPTPTPDKFCSLPSPLSDQTPTSSSNIASTPEPNPYTQPPPHPIFTSLPTPRLTPQPSVVNTPAVSVGGFLSRKPSISAAMSHANNMCATRIDPRFKCTYSRSAPAESYHPLARRSSLARSTSSTSSPESMISDVPSLTSSRSSRSSRSSSISSVASGTCAPAQPRLAMRATRRRANLRAYSASAKDSQGDKKVVSNGEGGCMVIYDSPATFSTGEGSLPPLSSFLPHGMLGDPDHEAAQGLCALSGALPRSTYPSHPTSNPTINPVDIPTTSTTAPLPCRKRTRTPSNDFTLQSHVREELRAFEYLCALRSDEDDSTVTPDNQVADSFLIPQPQTMQSPLGLTPPRMDNDTVKLPMPSYGSGGSVKRTCCAREASGFWWGSRDAVEGNGNQRNMLELAGAR
ncbi:hypothetical protein AJ79_02952 [Helicocarpus griseus UAMH5409]|uniref:Cyclin N-terminal domain-containing protein n=1 Tax=Helicocarpus griseus UAMH5409 TaxID=1447875 RepID=A0A2B7Y1M3_9EURO|nr:hypothetical protein AJ79_02952 [Helicocarpus griseus UAMH5409]